MSVINRKELLGCLESVSPGLATREIIEQSGCFAFLGHRVVTFNDEIACSIKIPIKLNGAVKAKPLLDLLRKLPEETVQVCIDDGKLIVEGKKRRGRYLLEKEISLPFEQVPEPLKWKPLPPDFIEGVNFVYRCAGKDTGTLDPYVHIHPERIEACTGTSQVGIFATTTNFKKPVLIHKDSIKQVISLGMIEFGMSDSWIHFRNKKELVLSCRIQEDTFPDTAGALAIKGTKIQLPKGIASAAERAGIFSSDNLDSSEVVVLLRTGKIIIKGIGTCGDFKEVKNIKYTGDELLFLISPQLLANIVQEHNEAWITKDTLKVKTGKFTFVTALGSPKKEKEEVVEEEGNDE